MSWSEARRLCLHLCMTTHTGMEFWLGCRVGELMDYAEEVAKMLPGVD